jgi:hypothetical protein
VNPVRRLRAYLPVHSRRESMAYPTATPLARKLGIKPGGSVLLVDAPDGFLALLDPLPENVTFTTDLSAPADLVHVFVTRQADVEQALGVFRAVLGPGAALWVSWPKRASKVPTDVTESTIREAALPLGLVDVKVCAVDEVWSGLKLVVRKSQR